MGLRDAAKRSQQLRLSAENIRSAPPVATHAIRAVNACHHDSNWASHLSATGSKGVAAQSAHNLLRHLAPRGKALRGGMSQDHASGALATPSSGGTALAYLRCGGRRLRWPRADRSKFQKGSRGEASRSR
jgi:hypothetical protein